jgi:DNA-binding HxlR family transcriptional regulator
VDLLGDWWTPLLLRDAMYGVRRFDDFERSLGVSRNVLSQRLTRLVDEGVLDKVAYQDRPARYEYRLTAKGRDLFGVLAALMAWGDRWLAPDGPPVTLRHTTCGQVTSAVVTCSECGDPLTLRDVHPLPRQ